jgi:hypothetical protein
MPGPHELVRHEVSALVDDAVSVWTSDKGRPDAIRFYEALGFTPTHEGLKLSL